MAYFAYGFTDKEGVETIKVKHHVCYAFFGHMGAFDKFYFTAGCFVQAVNKEEEVKILTKHVNALRDSCIAKEGATFEVVEDFEHFSGLPAIRVQFPMDLPAWRVFRICKLAGKLFGYGSQVCNTYLSFLDQGATFEEAQFLAVANCNYSYMYPHCYAESKEAVTEFLKKRVMFTEPKVKYGSAGAFKKHSEMTDPSLHYGSYCLDEPFPWQTFDYTGRRNMYSYIGKHTLEEFREYFGL